MRGRGRLRRGWGKVVIRDALHPVALRREVLHEHPVEPLYGLALDLPPRPFTLLRRRRRRPPPRTGRRLRERGPRGDRGARHGANGEERRGGQEVRDALALLEGGAGRREGAPPELDDVPDGLLGVVCELGEGLGGGQARRGRELGRGVVAEAHDGRPCARAGGTVRDRLRARLDEHLRGLDGLMTSLGRASMRPNRK